MSLVHEIDNGFLLVPNVKNYDHKSVVFIKEVPPEIAEALKKHAAIEAEEAKKIAACANQAQAILGGRSKFEQTYQGYQNEKMGHKPVTLAGDQQPQEIPTLDQEVTDRIAA